MFGGFGWQELMIILIIVVVLFGATRIPQIMRGLGIGVKEFRSAIKDDAPSSEHAETTMIEKDEKSEH